MKNLMVAILAMTVLVATAEARRDQNREPHQQSRIKQGVQSGSLTRKEAKKLHKGQKHVDNLQKKAMADGEVSGHEKLRIEKAQDSQNRKIYRQKHDEQNRRVMPNQPSGASQNSAVPAEESENN